MSKSALTKIEKLHISVQILAQITTIVAAIAVAIWSLYSTIYVKKEKEITDYTLKELALKTELKPHVQARVESKTQSVSVGGRLLEVKVTLSNLGNQESRVTLDDKSIMLVPVLFTNGIPIYQQPINLYSGRYAGTLNRMPLRFVDIGAGESYEITFIHRIDNPGTYLIHFLALNGVNPSSEKLSVVGVPFNYSVGADQYVVVE